MIDRMLMVCLSLTVIPLAFLIWNLSRREEEFLRLSLACLRRGLSSSYGRGMDDLLSKVRDDFMGSLVASPRRDELMLALAYAIDGLLQEAEDIREMANKVEPQLRELSVEGEI